MPNGLFISLDGLDGAGKSTHCRLLAQWLRSKDLQVTECADPGGTALGKVLRDLLLSHRQHIALPCEALLFMASRAQLVDEVIKPALASGQVVVCDRFLLANVVYQGYGGGLDPAELYAIGRLATGGLEPDVTFVLDLPLAVARERRKSEADRLESRDDAFHARVHAGFLVEAGKHPDRIHVVDAAQAPEQVQEAIRRHVQRFLAALTKRGQDL